MTTPTELVVYRAPPGKGFGALAWYRKWVRAQVPNGPPAAVPCGSCTVCCRSYEEIPVYPDDGIPLADLDRTATGEAILRRQADGACVYLVNDRCQIYSRRPHACRSYDCRAVLVLGQAGSNEHAVTTAALANFGRPLAKEPDDEAFLLAVHLMVIEALRREVSPLTALGVGKWKAFLPIVHNPAFRHDLEAAAKDPGVHETLTRARRAP